MRGALEIGVPVLGECSLATNDCNRDVARRYQAVLTVGISAATPIEYFGENCLIELQLNAAEVKSHGGPH